MNGTLYFSFDYWVKEVSDALRDVETGRFEDDRINAANALLGAAHGLHEHLLTDKKVAAADVQIHKSLWQKIYSWYKGE